MSHPVLLCEYSYILPSPSFSLRTCRKIPLINETHSFFFRGCLERNMPKKRMENPPNNMQTTYQNLYPFPQITPYGLEVLYLLYLNSLEFRFWFVGILKGGRGWIGRIIRLLLIWWFNRRMGWLILGMFIIVIIFVWISDWINLAAALFLVYSWRWQDSVGPVRK